MMLRTPLVAVALILLLAGCAIGKPIPEATTYAIEPPAPAPAPVASRRAETLRMGKVRVAPNFADRALVVRVDEVRYAADFYNSFIAPPGDMLGAVMADWLNEAGAFATVTQPGTLTPTAFVLEATVTKLYGDFRPGRTPSAIMEIQFSLVELSGISPTVRLEQTIGRSVPLSESTPQALVQGYGRALAEILSELSAALQKR